jgi:multidrug resistance protein MdtO
LPAARSKGFFLPDAFTNREYIDYALKTTGAAIFCYCLYSLLDWTSIHTAFITCYIVSLGTTAETIEKLSLRVLGCIFGALTGIVALVYVMPDLTSIGALLGVVFVGALASAWVAAGSPRISYAGFQFAFAFFLSVIQGPSPKFDLTVARDRTIGILLGNLVVYVIFTRVSPVSMAKRIDSELAAALRRLRAMAASASLGARRSLAGQVQGALGDIQQNIDLARYEPQKIRATDRWLEARREAVNALGALQAPILLGREAYSASDAERHLEGAADGLSAATASATSGDEVGKAETVDIDAGQSGVDQTTAKLSPGQHYLAEIIVRHVVALDEALGVDRSPAKRLPPHAQA